MLNKYGWIFQKTDLISFILLNDIHIKQLGSFLTNLHGEDVLINNISVITINCLVIKEKKQLVIGDEYTLKHKNNQYICILESIEYKKNTVFYTLKQK